MVLLRGMMRPYPVNSNRVLLFIRRGTRYNSPKEAIKNGNERDIA